MKKNFKILLYIYALIAIFPTFSMEEREREREQQKVSIQERMNRALQELGWQSLLPLRASLQQLYNIEGQRAEILDLAYASLVEKKLFDVLDQQYPAFKAFFTNDQAQDFFKALQNFTTSNSRKDLDYLNTKYFNKYPALKPILLQAQKFFTSPSPDEQQKGMAEIVKLLYESDNKELNQIGNVLSQFMKAQVILWDAYNVISRILVSTQTVAIQQFLTFMTQLLQSQTRDFNFNRFESIITDRKKGLPKSYEQYLRFINDAKQELAPYKTILQLFPQTLLTDQELESARQHIKKIEVQETEQQQSFLPKEVHEFEKRQQTIETQRRRSRAQRKRAAQLRKPVEEKIQPQPELEEEKKETLISPTEQLRIQRNSAIKPQFGEELLELSKWVVKIKKGDTLFTIYNLTGDESHLNPTMRPQKTTYDPRVQRWHTNPEETAALLNPDQPQIHSAQIIRHVFPKSLFAYFKNLGKLKKDRDEHGKARHTLYHWGELQKGNLKLEGLFVTGIDPSNGVIYHQYFIPKFFYDVLQEEFKNEDLASFIETYKTESFPALK